MTVNVNRLPNSAERYAANLNGRALIERAKLFAAKAHAEMERKTGGPYVQHTTRVAELLADHGHEPATVAAGHLHDVVEDTDVTYADLVAEFGKRTANVVMMVTDPNPWPSKNNRGRRKEIERAHLARATYEGASVKLADMIDNLGDIDKLAAISPRYRKFIKLYKGEAKLAHAVLGHGDPKLYKKLGNIVARF